MELYYRKKGSTIRDVVKKNICCQIAKQYYHFSVKLNEVGLPIVHAVLRTVSRTHLTVLFVVLADNIHGDRLLEERPALEERDISFEAIKLVNLGHLTVVV